MTLPKNASMKLSTSCLSRVAFIFLVGLASLTGCAGGREALKPEAALLKVGMRIAVLPLENLSGTSAPVAEIRRGLLASLAGTGLQIIDEGALNQFMGKHRIRYTGGIDNDTSQALKRELGADGVLITSLELYDEGAPPKIALISRLVSSGEKPEINWMESVGVAGDDAPGILGLGLIREPKKLQEKALGMLTRSLARHLSDGAKAGGVAGRYAPKVVYSALSVPRYQRPSIAVLPFFNQSTRRYAGEIEVLHFIKALVDTHRVEVVEPGIVRDRMLKMRIIMSDGVSLPSIDAIAINLNVDYVLSGKVFDYQDYGGGGGKPKIDFSIQLIERVGKKIVWASKSYNEGDDGVFLYDWGRLNTASVLATKMTRAVVQKMFNK